MNQTTIYRITLLLCLTGITLLFLFMIKKFLLTIFLAAIFSMLLYPVYERFMIWFGGRKGLASLSTILLLLLFFLIPLGGLVTLITAQALSVTKSVRPWMQEHTGNGAFRETIRNLPFYETLQPILETVLQKTGELVNVISTFIVDNLSGAAVGTLHFLFLIFIFFYALFYFLIDGKKIIRKILFYIPLPAKDEDRLLKIFGSVSRATIKSTLVIGLLQGSLAGLAFAVAGIPAAAFWGTIMAFLSFIPGIGSPFVWVPTVVILMIQGHWGKAIGLLIFCAMVVGTVDNILRPRMVGRDTKVHNLLILLSMLGGIMLFGFLGIIVGPVIAALFVSIWEIYGEVFRQYLPRVGKEKA